MSTQSTYACQYSFTLVYVYVTDNSLICCTGVYNVTVDAGFHFHFSLNLEHNQLTSFNGLLQLPNLKVLCLNHNKIERLSTGEDAGGGVLPSLQVLHVAYNQLGSLVPLQLHRMPTLRALFLQGMYVHT